MAHDELRRSLKDQVTGTAAPDSAQDIALQKASADVYKQRMKIRINDHRADWWIAAALYLILTGVAFVVL